MDTDIQPFVKPNKTRYAHKRCAEENEKKKEQEERDKQERLELEECIKKIFNVTTVPLKIKK